jgi:hypothetical protein
MGIPVIVCFKKSADHRTPAVDYDNPDHTRHTLQIGEGYVSLMALGLPTVFKVISYQTEQEGINSLVNAVGTIKKDEPGTVAERCVWYGKQECQLPCEDSVILENRV